MSTELFEVEVLDCDSKNSRWVQVLAADRQEAIQRVALLGEIVGNARIASDHIVGRSSMANDRTELPSEAGAAALAWLGLIFGPLAIAGLIWGGILYSKTQGRRGSHSLVVGVAMTAIWGIGLLWLLSSGLY